MNVSLTEAGDNGFASNALAHAMSGERFFVTRRGESRLRDPRRDEITVGLFDHEPATWYSAGPEGFFDQTIKLFVPRRRYAVIQVFHDLYGKEVRQYTATTEGDFEVIPLSMMGREISYIVGWKDGIPAAGCKLILHNPDKPDQPVVFVLTEESTDG